MDKIKFKEELAKHNIILTEKMEEQFQMYFDMLVYYNKVMDLTAVKDEDIYERHFFDSLTIAFDNDFSNCSLCDVGAGAGFPSIPLKIIFPSMKLTIIDPLTKRMDFLRLVISKLHLENVELKIMRSEDASRVNRECYDIVTARAVARLNILLEIVSQMVKVNGLLIAMKGKKAKEELLEASKAMKICNMELVKESNIASSCNLFFKKTGSIILRYPRNYSQIKQKPL